MNTTDLLEQLLRSGRGGTPQGGAATSTGQGGLGDLFGSLLGGAPGAGSSAGGLGGLLGGFLGGAGGAGVGGATAGRSAGGAGKYAALASLGMMAFKAYQAWQQQQASAPQQAFSTVDQLSGPAAEAHSHAILRALIAAAKADGRIDDAEKKLIYAELARHADDPQLQQWLNDEVSRPLDAASIAQEANGPGMAAEMYLASVMLIDQQQAAERVYLDELGEALGLAPELRAQLEQQAAA
jgi:uncharacterized membrane protein YebE (DUF533 family)